VTQPVDDDAADAAVTASPGTGGPSKRVALAILVVLSAQFAVLSGVEAWRDSPTYDEVFHLAGGTTALTRHQFRLTPEHDALPKVLGALPALLAHPDIPSGPAWRNGDGNTYYGMYISAQDDIGKVQRVFFIARLVSIAEAIALAFALYALASALFGRMAGLIAAAAWLTTPVVVAFGHIDGSDLPFALAIVVTCLTLQRWMVRPTNGRLVLVGLAASAVLLTRFAGLALIPAVAVVVGVGATDASVRRRIASALSVPLIAWAGVWAVFRIFSPRPEYRHTADFAGALKESGLTRAARIVPWPIEYDAGLRQTGQLASASGESFLFGHHTTGASPAYWPGALLVKLPISAVLLVVAAFGFWFVCRKATRVQALLVVALPLVVLLLLVLPYKRPSFRYFLPCLALFFVLGAAVFAWSLRYSAGRVVVGVLAAVQLVSLWTAFPHSLAWTAPPFHPSYRVIGDTNDWGQDYYRLQDWAAGKNAHVAYFGALGTAPPIPGTRPLAGAPASELPGWVAVSAAYLTHQAFMKQTDWLRSYCPVGTIGDSILLYRFKEAPDVTRTADVVPRPCDDEYSEPVS
jgi:hypothetical protein